MEIFECGGVGMQPQIFITCRSEREIEAPQEAEYDLLW